jgi:hypothetical protein
MRKFVFMILPFLAMIAIITSCTKKNNSTDPNEKFSTLSVEANKAIVENAGINFITVLKRLKDIQTVDVLVNLGDITSSSNNTVLTKGSKLLSTFSTFTAAAKGETKMNNLFKSLVSPKELAQDYQSIKEFWDSNVGTYTWNPSNNDWTIALGGTKIIMKFPSTDVSTTNDATLTISNYAGIIVSNSIDDNYTGDLPVALNADLKVGTKTLITYVFSAHYNTDGIPSAVASDLTIENYKFEADITNDTKIASVSYKFLENDVVVMNLSATGKGLFTQANYNANTTTHTETNTYISNYVWNSSTQQWDPVYSTYTDQWDETEFEEIINSSIVEFRLSNIALSGDCDIKGLTDQIRLIQNDLDNQVITSAKADSLYTIQINKFLNLRLVNVSSNEIIAKANAYVVKEINYGYVDTYINFRLTFKDGSPIDLDTYTNSGFGNFVTELNGLINDINSEYDLGIETVDYKK